MLDEVVFEVHEAEEGGYYAAAVGCDIITQGDTWEELKLMAQDAVLCHFDDYEMAKICGFVLHIDCIAITADDGQSWFGYCQMGDRPMPDKASEQNVVGYFLTSICSRYRCSNVPTLGLRTRLTTCGRFVVCNAPRTVNHISWVALC